MINLHHGDCLDVMRAMAENSVDSIVCDPPYGLTAGKKGGTGAASAVRFHLWNIHKGCSICNNHLSGNIAEYLPRVRARIGDDKVDWIYTQNDLVRHDVAYLARFKAVMGKRLRRMEKAA